MSKCTPTTPVVSLSVNDPQKWPSPRTTPRTTRPARVSSERARAREDETEERRAVGRRRGGVTRDGPWDSGSGESGRGAGVQRAEKRCAGELPHPRTRTPLPENRHEPSARRYGTQLTPSPPQRHQACCHPALQVAQGCRPEGV
ncbi:hypothetical protein CC85DRAFT_326022 [Cutaneotrichosporon oleaginosum]|uniref:Uncharacterized protein n=1 Tax=Cutaneotrichosporon oleaginosum TaxID=879819 RepID=A0A0J0XVL2_9TREE|nr:uncharacterized protein CC85DRAFT_326022 [Cutaneotrichosporon oleaginosum]KLT45112.1 hypothetical protein CC85DRAFT_326022 [Cutaneotrichosporon oleaginosum]TXT09793.1 hypothetical protein COLE_03727 [Cutaneotrichosporon oleaginosum]